jgi:hypothetical protein
LSETRERKDTLVARTVQAHRAYVAALSTFESSVHLATCPACRSAGVTVEEYVRRSSAAEAEKERKRVVFRGLCDELGYVPEGHGVAVAPLGCPLCADPG